MRAAVFVVVFAVTLCSACATKDEEPAKLAGDTPCDKWASLSRIMGCAVPEAEAGCLTASAECTELANAWLECAARDRAQCLCESDDNGLNCEGSFKPDEGPAGCVAEYRAFDACKDP